MLTVAKFGGSSLADARGFQTVRERVTADPARRGVVVSAPGRRFAGDPKITDLLYACYEARQENGPWEPVFRAVAGRFREICRLSGAFLNMETELEALEKKIREGVSRDYLASRGEYFSALILSRLLDWKFIDSARWLRFDEAGRVDTVRSCGLLRQLADRPFVTPGFYGAMPDGEIRTFTRGGSDITGALAAAALDAGLYENWTDVCGILQADPRLLPEAQPVRYMTYGELAELTAVGTQVLHEGAVRPVREAGIPLHIRSTFCPEDPGTVIVPQLPEGVRRSTLLCLAGLRDRTLISLESRERGLLSRLLREAGAEPDFLTAAFGRHTATVAGEQAERTVEAMGPYLGQVTVRDAVALVAVIIAREEARGPLGADLLAAVRQEHIPIHAILRPFGGHTLLLAVPDGEYERTLRALHRCADGGGFQVRS